MKIEIETGMKLLGLRREQIASQEQELEEDKKMFEEYKTAAEATIKELDEKGSKFYEDRFAALLLREQQMTSLEQQEAVWSKEKVGFTSKLNALQKMISSLEAKLEEAKKGHSDVLATIEPFDESLYVSLQTEYAALKNKHDALKIENENLKKKVKEPTQAVLDKLSKRYRDERDVERTERDKEKRAFTEAAIKAKERFETELATVNKEAQRRIEDEKSKFDKDRQTLRKAIETAKADNHDYGAREQERTKRCKEFEEKFNEQKAIAEAAREKIEKMDKHIIEIEQSRPAIIQMYGAEIQKHQAEIAMLRLENTRLQNNFFSQAQPQSSSVFVSPLNPYIYNNNGGAQLENWNEYSEQAQQPMRQPVQQTVQQPMRQPVQQTVQRPMQLSPPKPIHSASVQQSPNREENQHREQI